MIQRNVDQQVLSRAIPNYAQILKFARTPFASASIGQVHQGTLASTASPTSTDEKIAIKIQFPGVKDSIESDLGYLKWLLTVGSVLPKGLFLERTLSVSPCGFE